MKCCYCEHTPVGWLERVCPSCGSREPVELSPFRTSLYLVPIAGYLGGTLGYALGEPMSGRLLGLVGAVIGTLLGGLIGLYVGLAVAPGVFRLAQWLGRSWGAGK